MTKYIQLDYRPYPHQAAYHESKARFNLLLWPTRSGKNEAAAPSAVMKTVSRHAEWRERNSGVDPKKLVPGSNWNVWATSPTYKLSEQLWANMLKIMPRELIEGEPLKGKLIPLRDHGAIKFRSTDNPDHLAAEAVDHAMLDECCLMGEYVWANIRDRISSPGRFGTADLFGTPQGMKDPKNPMDDHWVWKLYLRSLAPDSEVNSFYWFKDKVKYGGLDHPILSRTPEGRAEIESKRNDPAVSERMFRQNTLGEMLPLILGQNIIEHFIVEMNVYAMEFRPRFPLIRSWDLGRQWPVVQFHQLWDGNHWDTLDEICPFNRNLLDTDLADMVIKHTAQHFPEAAKNSRTMLLDVGDFEAVQETDQRRDSTINEFRKKGINLIVNPTLGGDEQKAIAVMDNFLKVRNDGHPGWRIHPRCLNLIACLSGAWIYPKHKVQGVTQIEEKVAEIHPSIDVFDSTKYLIKHRFLDSSTIGNGLVTLRLGQPQVKTVNLKDGSWTL